MCAWTEPVTWDTSKALSVTRLNEQLRDNMQYLYDNWGASGWGHNYVRNGHFDGWLAGASAAPDCWGFAGDAIAQEDTIIKVGTYSAKMTSGAAAEAELYQLPAFEFMGQLRGQAVTLGAWVYASAADRVKVRIDDGVSVVDSDYHSGSGDWEFLTVTLDPVDAGGSIVAVIHIDAGDAIDVYVDGVILTAGPLPSLFQNGINDWAPRLLQYQDATATNFRLGGGLMMQIGQSPGAGGDITVTFPVAFSAAPLMVLCVGYDGANTYWVTTITAGGFVAKRVGSVSAGVQWMAIGME